MELIYRLKEIKFKNPFFGSRLISGGKWLRRNCLVKTVDSLKVQLPRGLAILPAVKAFNQRKVELEAARI